MDNLETQLKTQLDQATQLLAILRKEHDTLKERNMDALRDVTQTKDALVAQMQQWSAMNETELELQTKTMSDQNKAQMRKLWQEIKLTLEKCRDDNLVNGMLLQRHLLTTNELLRILKGQPEATDTYEGLGGKK